MCVQQFPKTRMSGSAWMCSGNQFHVMETQYKNARPPNLVRN